MRQLWKFERRDRLEEFLALLREHGIEHEVVSKANSSDTGEFTVAVDEGYYAKAKRLLLKQRKRRTSADK
jgi:hypothetical protein